MDCFFVNICWSYIISFTHNPSLVCKYLQVSSNLFKLLFICLFYQKKCGFFKRFEPQEINKYNENNIVDQVASNDEDTTTNDVIDISKQCLTHNSINNTTDKTTLLKLSTATSLLQLPLPPPPPPPPLEASLSISTASSLLASPKQSNQRFLSRNQNHKLLSTNLNSNNNSLYSDVLLKSEMALDKSQKLSSNVYILPVNNKNQQNENIKASPATSIKFSTFQNATSNSLNNSNSNLYSTPSTTCSNNESFTNKLPPVPKRVNINTNNNMINSNQKISLKNTDTSNATAKFAMMNSALNNNNNKTMFIQSQDSPHLRIGSYDTMNYKIMAKQQNNQNKNSHNSNYATYRSLNSNNKKNIQTYEENRHLNLRNEHNI
jgi:hypothetical protein